MGQEWDYPLFDSSIGATGRHPRYRIIAGDLNTIADTTRPDGVIEAALTLLKSGSIPSTHYAFLHGRYFLRDRFIDPPSVEDRCIKINPSGKQCLNRRWNRSLVKCCWDDTCVYCKKERTAWKVPLCGDCASNPEAIKYLKLGGDHLLSDEEYLMENNCLFSYDIDIGAKYVNAYEVATGSLAPFDTVYIDRPVKCSRDHIFFNEEGFRLYQVSRPIDLSIVCKMPTLSWPSDHFSLVVDLEIVKK